MTPGEMDNFESRNNFENLKHVTSGRLKEYFIHKMRTRGTEQRGNNEIDKQKKDILGMKKCFQNDSEESVGKSSRKFQKIKGKMTAEVELNA